MQACVSEGTTIVAEDCLDLEKNSDSRGSITDRPIQGRWKVRNVFTWLCQTLAKKLDTSPLDNRSQIRSIDKAPSGYPRLAAFVDSDPNFMIFRRFGYLRSRLILNQQDVLRNLEQGLDRIDAEDAGMESQRRFLCCREGDESQARPVRKRIFGKLKEELKVYGSINLIREPPRLTWLDDLLLRTAAVLKLSDPDHRNERSIKGLIWNDGQLRRPDREYIQHADDLVALSGDKEHSWVHSTIEMLCTRHSPRLSKKVLFRNRIQDAKTTNPALGINLFASSRFDRIVAVLFTILIIALLMAPVFVLCALEGRSGYVQNAVTLGFTTFFALLCSTCTTAKRHEIFAATAAYCAVLVVFTSPKG